MNPEKSKITQGQLMFFVIQSQVGVGILSLPHKLQDTAKGGAWISSLIAGLAVQVIILILWALCRRFPSDTIYSFLPKIAGNLLGNLLGFAYIGYFLFSAGTVLALFADVVGKWVLQATPRWALLILTLLTCIYLVKERLRVIARMFVISSLTIIVMVLFSLIGYTHANITYIFPIMEAGWWGIIKAANDALFPLVGYEVLLVIYPFVEGKSYGKLKAASLGNMLITLFYTFEVFTSLIIFSPGVMPAISEPLLYMLKGFSFQIIQRIDLIFLSLWIFIVSNAIASWLYMATVGLGRFFHRGKHKKAVPYAACIVFILAMIAQDPSITDLYDRMIRIFHYTFVVGLPLILLIFSYLSRKRRAEAR
ncbi:spore germination protein (amino acid permease) [Aneurinibacillus soli]|uniref:Spore germination protein YndE n=1 Tax=Aneurinibacillus soli TaxID=1500254 RepID=A0A0U5B5S4_9BACL|nr:endospore germination permease [Aneurinibacillus soli]PYE61249.1 spore germination protein (amino acid permease) [Aneurinibacillus soli]BAU26316.1 Spore germination protein YndE [Aneurinibacillus soli]